MISVTEALEQLFALTPVLEIEDVPLIQAAGRVLARAQQATRDQPPFPASAMDGYAIQKADGQPGQRLQVVGESAAGHRYDAPLQSGQAVRIFTGGVVPEGADWVVIQEDVHREGNWITLGDTLEAKSHIRPAGVDFATGTLFKAPRRLTPQDVALLASMNIPRVPVHRRPKVALISTGDELVMPGEEPGPDQIIASNTFGLHAMLQALGAEPRLLPIARDTEAALALAFDLAQDADLIITIGGASVGDHDVVARVMAAGERQFYKVAMRPGKPLMAGRIGASMMMGLPGNPVSAMVCGHVFVAPVVHRMMGLPAEPAPRQTARLAHDIGPGGPREHYMRATITDGQISPAQHQDSSLLSVLAQANALMIRPAHDGPRVAGSEIDFLPL
ncbi:gephyrin-like molybdotransferase Glp [Primorskyibacter sp. S187A]|uniref:molybdopterin molybdotransferase MoeA n=1 Tax=Primorskyibacter sp. S187A TaxID=3415130 RepID=UPI003C7EB245